MNDDIEPVTDDIQRVRKLLDQDGVRLLVFTGSGISVAAGCQTFATPGGLYEKVSGPARSPIQFKSRQARKRYKLKDGKVCDVLIMHSVLPLIDRNCSPSLSTSGSPRTLIWSKPDPAR